jgi:hypothetical protein
MVLGGQHWREILQLLKLCSSCLKVGHSENYKMVHVVGAYAILEIKPPFTFPTKVTSTTRQCFPGQLFMTYVATRGGDLVSL